MGNSNRILLYYNPPVDSCLNLENFIKFVNERIKLWQDKDLSMIRIHLAYNNRTIFDPTSNCYYNHVSLPQLLNHAFDPAVTVVKIKKCSRFICVYHVDLHISPKTEEIIIALN